jgi:nicotinate-nucleotide pyrophosphorylase (carboxylating)
MMSVDKETVRRIVAGALDEDQVRDDATVALLDFGDRAVAADIVIGDNAVVAGLACAREAFRQLDDDVSFEAKMIDGTHALEGDVAAQVAGRADSILRAERVALNFLQRLSGVATMASRFVSRVAGSSITILDTRKTTPLWRDLEKHAVRCGGAQNHRRDLGEMVLIKENHIRALGGTRALLERLRQVGRSADRPFIEVEVDSLELLEQMIGAPVDRVMLDNFSPDDVRAALEVINRFRRSHPRAALEVEVSGGITLDTIDHYVIPGVDFVSVGALTHSAPAVPVSLEVR